MSENFPKQNNIEQIKKKEFNENDLVKLSFILSHEFSDIKSEKLILNEDDLDLLVRAYNFLFKKDLDKPLDSSGAAKMERIQNIIKYCDEKELLFSNKNINLVSFVKKDKAIDIFGILETYKDKPDLLRDFFSKMGSNFYKKIDIYQITALKEGEIKIIINNDINKATELFKIRKEVIDNIEKNKKAS